MTEKTKISSLKIFDMADHLRDEADINEYFSQVLEDGDSSEIMRALGHIARARGIAQVAKDSGLGRESLYKALAVGAKPRFDTVNRVCNALGLRLTSKPINNVVS